DSPEALGMIEELLEDAERTSPPVIVIGSLSPEASARAVALGVAGFVPAPPHGAALALACEEAIAQSAGPTALGQPTLEELGARRDKALCRARVDRVPPQARDARIELGEGTEVMGALWGTIARVREIVTARSGGAVQFAAGQRGNSYWPSRHNDVARGDR